MQVWAVPPKEMQCEWLGERVATVDVDRAIRNVIHNKEDAGWGPNAVFRFPLEGGTGGIWKGVARLLPQDRQVSQQNSNLSTVLPLCQNPECQQPKPWYVPLVLCKSGFTTAAAPVLKRCKPMVQVQSVLSSP